MSTLRATSSLHFNPNWLKEPFSIGYPEKSSPLRALTQQLDKALFGAPTSQDIETVSETFSINKQILTNTKYLKAAIDQPKPEKFTGLDLFNYQYDYLGLIRPKTWESLDNDIKQLFYQEKYVATSFDTSVRLWKGYETVKLLKRFSNQSFNPYLYVDLRPVEIIIDKLNPRYKFKSNKSSEPIFKDLDYYDVLINQALQRQPTTRNIHQIIYSELKPDDFTGIPSSQVLKYDMEPHREYYYQKYINRKCHRFFLTTKPTKIPTNYNNYLKTISRIKGQSITELGPEVRDKWRAMDSEEKRSFQLTNSSERRINAFNKLMWQVSVVLYYIYEVGYVHHIPAEYDWRHQMDFKYYTNGHYLDYYLYARDNRGHVL